MISALSPRRPAVSIDVIAYAIIAFLVVTAGAFETDDAAYFNYLNNVIDARPFYYYTGYVHLIPQAVSYLLSPLPLIAQVLLYPVVPIAIAVLLYRELRRLLAAVGTPTETGVMALSIILGLRLVEIVLWANLSNAMWLALVAAATVLIRVDTSGERLSSAMAIGIVIAGLSFPPGGLLAGLLLLGAARHSGHRLQRVALALVIIAGHLMIAGTTQDDVWNTHLAGAPWLFVSGFRDSRFLSLTATVSVLALGATLAWAWTRARDWRDSGLAVIGSLCCLGWGSIALYVASSRFVRYDGGFQARYVVPVLFSALTAVAWSILAGSDSPSRLRRVGAMAGVAVACAGVYFYSNLRGPLETTLLRYRFVMFAAAEREHCQDGDVFVYDDDSTSPVLLCRPRALPPGNYVLTDFTPSIGARGQDVPADERPTIMNPRPLF